MRRTRKMSDDDIHEPAPRSGSVLIIAFVVFLSALAGLIGWLYVTASSDHTEQSFSNSTALSAPQVIAQQPPAPPSKEENAAPVPTGQTKAESQAEPKAAESTPAPDAKTAKEPEVEPAPPAAPPAETAAATKIEETADAAPSQPMAELQKPQSSSIPANKKATDAAAPKARDEAAVTALAVRPEPAQKLTPPSETTPQAAAQAAAKPANAPEVKSKPAIAEKPKPQIRAAVQTPGRDTGIKTQPSMTFSLPPAPDPALITRGSFGMLPIIGPTGKLPWKVYARPFHDPMERPQIALIISDMGMSEAATLSVIQRLPGAVTMSFNPYAKSLQNWIEQSRSAGHEVILQLPMEPYGYPENDPGPHTLLTSLSTQENLDRLEWLLSRFTGYTGVTSQMGSKFISSDKDIEPVLAVIKKSGLLFVDTRSSRKSVSARIAKSMDLPVAINNRYLDNSASRDAIDARLAELERIARVTGSAVGIGYPYPVTIERVAQWSESLARKGIVLVPVSEIVNKQELE